MIGKSPLILLLLLCLGLVGVSASLVDAQEFRRGNCNNDCAFDISDPIFLAQRIFMGGSAPVCDKACDANDDGQNDIADIVVMLSALFGMPSVPLPPPYLTCGLDPTADTLTCSATSCVNTSPAPTGMTASIVGGVVLLGWVSPDPCTGTTQVRVVRTLTVPALGPDDPFGTVVFQGTASAATEPLTELSPDTVDVPRTYVYTVFGCTGSSCQLTGSSAFLTPTVTQCLVGGGYTIYFRHGLATTCADRTDLGTAATTTVPGWWLSCDASCPPVGGATARQIDPTGIAQGTQIGVDMAARGIPVGRVVSSEFCRCIDTAEAMAFPPAIETNQGITFFVYDEANRCFSSVDLLEEVPAAGTNTVIVGHAGMVCPVLGTLAMGEGAIHKPDGQGGTVYQARVVFNGWLAVP